MTLKKEDDAPVVAKSAPKAPAQKGMVTITLLKGGWLRHPCGITIIQGKPVELPDDSWTNSQIDAGLATKLK